MTLLDPGEYKGTFKLIGGETCFEFTNTVSWRETDHPHEWLDSVDNLLRWAEITGILDNNQTLQLKNSLKNASEAAFEQLKKTREFLYSLFNSQVNNRSITPDVLQKLSILTQKAIKHQVLSASPTGYEWSWQKNISPLDQLHFEVILSASEVLTRGDMSRIKKCPSCQWLFLDTSKNKSRRWCTMEDCGNRHKVNAFNRKERVQKEKTK